MLFLTCQITKANNEEEAIKKAGEALYIQSGLNKIVEHLDKQYTPKIVKEYSSWLFLIQKAAIEKQISCKWAW